MNEEEFRSILESEDDDGRAAIWDKGCNAFKGILIIRKYMPDVGIEGAGHDVIYSAGVEDLVEAGITKEDTIELRRQNWMIEHESLACFV